MEGLISIGQNALASCRSDAREPRPVVAIRYPPPEPPAANENGQGGLFRLMAMRSGTADRQSGARGTPLNVSAAWTGTDSGLYRTMTVLMYPLNRPAVIRITYTPLGMASP
jgi:hypothetical protein